MSPQRAFLAFAASVFVFHQLPSFAGDRGGAAVDVLTPFAVIGTSAAVLASLGARRAALVVALAAGILYVDGHGIHLAANSIHNETAGTDVDDVIYFWDERFSHVEAVLGWFGLVASFCLAESSARLVPTAPARRGAVAVLAAIVLGWTFFTSTVEGQTWWLELAATVPFVVWAIRSPRPILRTSANAFAVGAVLIAIWAVWHGGVPEFSDAELI